MHADKIRAVLFDAVGTLIYPGPPVAAVYSHAAQKFGTHYSVEQVARRFRAAILKNHQSGATSDELERERWGRIVYDVFDDVDDPERRMLEELWQHFGRAASWRLFQDVAPAWQELQSRGYIVGIASNFDSRLKTICRGLPPLDACRQIFVSSEVGYPKPEPQFYKAVEKHLGLPPEQILLIGDDLEADVTAPRAGGWRSIWLRRDRQQSSTEWICSLSEPAGSLSRSLP